MAQAHAADSGCTAQPLLFPCTAWLHPLAWIQMQHDQVCSHVQVSVLGAWAHTHCYLATLSAAEVHELEAIRDALAAIAPTKAIWKLHPTDIISLEERNVSLDIPANVMVTPFAPQNSLLGHPKLRAFLTQAGTNSFLEVSPHRSLGCAQRRSASRQHVASRCVCVLPPTHPLPELCSVLMLATPRELHCLLYSRARQHEWCPARLTGLSPSCSVQGCLDCWCYAGRYRWEPLQCSKCCWCFWPLLVMWHPAMLHKLSLEPGSPAGCLAWQAHCGPPTHAGAARQRRPCTGAGALNMSAGLRFLSTSGGPHCRASLAELAGGSFVCSSSIHFRWGSPAGVWLLSTLPCCPAYPAGLGPASRLQTLEPGATPAA